MRNKRIKELEEELEEAYRQIAKLRAWKVAAIRHGNKLVEKLNDRTSRQDVYSHNPFRPVGELKKIHDWIMEAQPIRMRAFQDYLSARVEEDREEWRQVERQLSARYRRY